MCSDLLFNQLYPQLVENMVAKGIFLESLESYIIADRLGHLPTPVMKDLLTHYQSNCMMESLERCIVHLDITSLDIQQVRIQEQIRVLPKEQLSFKSLCFWRWFKCVGRTNSTMRWSTFSIVAWTTTLHLWKWALVHHVVHLCSFHTHKEQQSSQQQISRS